MIARLESGSRSLAFAAMLLVVALPACSSTQDVLEPSAITPPATSSAATTDLDKPTASEQPNTSTTASTSNKPATAAGLAAVAAAHVQIAPIVGTSVEAANALSKGLSERARVRGIQLTGASLPPTHLLKGYFTPLVEGGEATVVFVWDVYDPKGNRIHRISGQQRAASAGGGEWAAVPGSAMQAIADTTIDQFAAWLAGSTG